MPGIHVGDRESPDARPGYVPRTIEAEMNSRAAGLYRL